MFNISVFNLKSKLLYIQQQYNFVVTDIYTVIFPEDVEFEDIKDIVINKDNFRFDMFSRLVEELNQIVNFLDILTTTQRTLYSELSFEINAAIYDLTYLIETDRLSFYSVSNTNINHSLDNAIGIVEIIVILFSGNHRYDIGNRVIYKSRTTGTITNLSPISENKMGYMVLLDGSENPFLIQEKHLSIIS